MTGLSSIALGATSAALPTLAHTVAVRRHARGCGGVNATSVGPTSFRASDFVGGGSERLHLHLGSPRGTTARDALTAAVGVAATRLGTVCMAPPARGKAGGRGAGAQGKKASRGKPQGAPGAKKKPRYKVRRRS